MKTMKILNCGTKNINESRNNNTGYNKIYNKGFNSINSDNNNNNNK